MEEARRAAGLADESIAVIIPVYNGSDYVGEAIESVLAQTLRVAEIIVVDDGSRDNTLEVARTYAGVTVLTQPNSGVSAARNRGVESASSAWIAFLDHDDVWLPQKLERQMQMLRADPEADVAVIAQQHFHVGPQGEKVFPAAPNYPPPSQKIARALYGTLRIVPSSIIVRRSLFLKAGRFQPDCQPCEDWDMWLQLEQAGAKFISSREPLLLYRQHATNISNNGRRMYNAEMVTYNRRIAPRVPALLRPLHRLRAESGFLAGMALAERTQGRPHRGAMLLSLLKYPFGNGKRYTIAAHMLLKGK